MDKLNFQFVEDREYAGIKEGIAFTTIRFETEKIAFDYYYAMWRQYAELTEKIANFVVIANEQSAWKNFVSKGEN